MTQTPDDEIAALMGLLLQDSGLDGSTLQMAVQRATALVAEGVVSGPIVYIVAMLMQRSIAAGMTEQLAPPLVDAAGTLLAGPLAPNEGLMLGITTAQAMTRLGRVDLAGPLLTGMRTLAQSTDERLQLARAEADLLYDLGERDRAVALLVDVLGSPDGADPSERLVTLSSLLTVWPRERPGMEPWIGEIERTSQGIAEPLRSAALIQVVMLLRGAGRTEEARAIAAGIDMAAMRSTGGGQFGAWIDEIERALLEQPTEGVGPDAAAATPTTAAGLMLARRFGPAGDAFLVDAQGALGRGFRIHAFDDLAAAGKSYQMADRNEEALRAFDEAFRLFEHDIVYLPRASQVIRRLASWPEIYTRAALAALGVGDPARAVDLAETGRSRAIGNRIGPSERSRPPSVPPDLWRRYVAEWRAAVARAANSLVDATPGSDGTADDPRDAELDELRAALLASGAQPEEITPLATPLRAAELIERLGRTTSPTTVLYSMRLDDSMLRFVRLSATGAEEIALDPADQAVVLTACDGYVRSLREHRGQMDRLIAEQAPELLRAVGSPLGQVVERALEGQPAGRLLWIPQGSLVTVPLSACPLGAGSVVDRAAVIVAPSLTVGAAATEPDVALPARVVSIRGRVEANDAPTDGGDRVLAPLTDNAPADSMPGSIEEWNAAVAGASLVHVTCHGVYDWDDPLRSYLKLGSDVSVDAMFDRGALEPGSLVLFGTCDSGTVAQGDINESIGLPTAFIGGGARAVVGAAWPVARGVAVATCLAFVRSLRGGLASVEALQVACAHVRDLTVGQFGAELVEAGHPLAEDEQFKLLISKMPDTKAFAAANLWPAYVYWGGGWTISNDPLAG